jgi:PAS domain S-box-containing protein
MSELAPQGIKRFSIVANLAILIVLAIAISVLFLMNYRQAAHEHATELRQEILRSKREFIQDAVNRTIQDIEQEQSRCTVEGHGSCAEEAIKERLRSRIRAIRLKDNGYIWVNAVLNYDGGDTYAYRFVHPNLPQTEGTMLSTNTRDVKGNLPYLTELEGVKRDGELFFDYWFKKMDSEVIQHKLTFAKLYKPYDWIVATGVYLDDIDALVQSGKSRWEKRYRRNVLLALVLTGMASLLAWILSLAVGMRVDAMYRFFLAEVARREEALGRHQESLEEKVRERTASLQASEAKYRRIVDTANEGIWMLGPDLKTIFANARMAEMLGCGVEEMLGRPATDYMFVDDVAGFHRGMEALRADGKPETLERRYRRQDGGTLWALVSVTPDFDEGQHGMGTFAMLSDITERKRGHEVTQARLRMLETARTAGMTVDDTLRRMLDEIESQTGSTIGFYHYMAEDQQTLTLQTWSTNTEATMCTTDGKGRHYPVTAAGVWADCVRERRLVIHNDYAALPQRQGLPAGHAAVIRELVVPVFRGTRIVAVIGVGNKPDAYNDTDGQIAALLCDFSWEIVTRKQAEEELYILNEGLEQRVGERTLELSVKNEELERMNQLFIDRELRMIELKGRLAELQAMANQGGLSDEAER